MGIAPESKTSELYQTIERGAVPALTGGGPAIVESDLAGAATPYLPLDIYETPDEFVVRALLPGVRPEAIDAQFHDGVLTLRTKVEVSGAPEGASCLVREIGAGEAIRRIELPRAIDIDRATTSFENGVLTLTLPKAPDAKPKQIKVVAEPQLAAPVTS